MGSIIRVSAIKFTPLSGRDWECNTARKLLSLLPFWSRKRMIIFMHRFSSLLKPLYYYFFLIDKRVLHVLCKSADCEEAKFHIWPSASVAWDSLGTLFMAELHESLSSWLNQKVDKDPAWRDIRVYLSGHDVSVSVFGLYSFIACAFHIIFLS